MTGDWLIRSPITNYRSPKKRSCTPLRRTAPVCPSRLKLQSGAPTAHGTSSLPLLSSDSGGVRRQPLHRTRPSTPRRKVRPHVAACTGNSAQLERVAGYKEPLPPRLARPNWTRPAVAAAARIIFKKLEPTPRNDSRRRPAPKAFGAARPISKAGADGRDRTDDLRFTKPLLYQLSYIGLNLSIMPATCSESFRSCSTPNSFGAGRLSYVGFQNNHALQSYKRTPRAGQGSRRIPDQDDPSA